MRLLPMILLLIALPVLTASADEASVYESVDEIAIGPVFLTPSERRWLDANRHLPRRSASQEQAQSADGDEQRPRATPAGYIINGSGETRRWRDGEFSRSVDSAEAMSFPDDVQIRRHSPRRSADTEAEESNDETADE